MKTEIIKMSEELRKYDGPIDHPKNAVERAIGHLGESMDAYVIIGVPSKEYLAHAPEGIVKPILYCKGDPMQCAAMCTQSAEQLAGGSSG